MRTLSRWSTPVAAAALLLPACTRDGAGEPATSDPPTQVTPEQPATPTTTSAPGEFDPTREEYDVPAGSRPHDVAPAVDGGVWYNA